MPGRDGGGASAYGRFDGTFGSNGTLKVPFVTTHALEVPVAVTQVPEPLKLPVAFVLEMEERVMEPDVSAQKLVKVEPLEL
jgi:hypothetical protein